ncbi:MAG: hypothetical protein IPI11_16255 [Haliscomenobacter sp.]|nr:hypothetical protein [Haliscomenobacter sp.]
MEEKSILATPKLSEYHLSRFLDEMLKFCEDSPIMLIYPERYYDEESLISFYSRVTNRFQRRFYFHGLKMISYRGGIMTYSAKMINKIKEASPFIVGMKEETPSYEEGFNLCSNIRDKESFEIIVAGGSMRRFALLELSGAQSFLSGIGSIYPQIELDFMKFFSNGEKEKAENIIRYLETPFFNVFFEVGWHQALRYALAELKLISKYQRRPFNLPKLKEKKEKY